MHGKACKKKQKSRESPMLISMHEEITDTIGFLEIERKGVIPNW